MYGRHKKSIKKELKKMRLHEKLDNITNVELVELQKQIDEQKELILTIMDGMVDLYEATDAEVAE